MKNNLKSILLSLIVMALWGSLFPSIKIAYCEFGISSTDIPGIIVLAGMRFLVCGFAVIIISLIKKEQICSPKFKNISSMLLIGLFAIVIHYSCVYIAISTTDSSKTAPIKQLGSLIYVCFSFLFFKNEKFNILKIIGAVIGFLGIVAINYTGTGITFSKGDLLIIIASFALVVSNIITKCISTNSPFWIVGVSQTFGGIALLIIGFIMGGTILHLSTGATLIFIYMCTASSIAYILWNHILKTSDLSNMFIIKFAEPLFACIFSAFLLGENILKIQYLLAFLLISLGIILGNKVEAKK